MAKTKHINKAFFILNIVVALLYLLTCLVPFLNAGRFWFIAILGLLFPLLFLAVFIFLIAWLLVRSRRFLLSLAALALSWQQLAVAFSWHTEKTFSQVKAAGNLRLLQWNVSSWDELNKAKKGGTSYRSLMLAEVKKTNADVLCFQEFFESTNPAVFNVNIPELQKMGYPYHYYVTTYTSFSDNAEMGIVIFSKFPIVNTGIYNFKDSYSVQQLIYTDVNFNGRTIRVFTIHLQSVHFEKNEYASLEEIKHREKSGLKDSRTIVSKLKKGYKFRSVQAEVVDSIVHQSPYPVLLSGDFNDVPNSYTYFKVRGNMQDAFLEKGSGIGRTFRFISPTLRIDYIFADKNFSVNQYHRLTVPYSDHYGIMADVSLVK